MRNVLHVATATIVSLLILGLTPLALAASLTQAQQQEAQVARELSNAQATYDAAINAEYAAYDHLQAVDAQLNQAASTLDTLTQQVASAKVSLANLQQQLTAAEAVVTNDTQQVNAALVTLDEHGFSVSMISTLFGAASFSDFLTRLDMLRRIWEMTNTLLHQAQAAEQKVADLEQQQAATTAHLTSLQQQAAGQVTTLQQDQVQAKAYQSAQTQAADQADAVVAQLEQQKSALASEIAKLIAELNSNSVPWSQVLSDIQALAKQYGIDPLLVEAVVLQESGGNSAAKSPVGSEGLMQLMPGTAAALGVNNVLDPVQNLSGGITYLLEMLHEFNGNLQEALAAYNAGPYAVKEYGGIPPYTETQNYVKDVLSLYNQGK